MMNFHTRPLGFALTVLLGLSFSAEARRAKDMPHPDFTKGDKIPEGATHDWTLGATGARGWIYSKNVTTSYARQIKVTKVAKGSPAEGVLATGDVILGTGDNPFSYDPRVEFGKALTIAEAESGNLVLIRWRDGKQGPVTVKLPVLGAYSATAPYDCPKSAKILELSCEALVKRMADKSYRAGAIPRSLNALALLASGRKKYLPLVKREAEWAAEYRADSMATWYYGYVITLLAEYVMKTGDQSVMPGLKRLTLEAARGQSIVGSWGHKFAGEDGRLVGYGMMNAPGVPLTISLVMAKGAGVTDPEIDQAIERSAKLLRFYRGKGAVPYGDHDPWIQTHEDNGKSGMAAVLFNLKEEKEAARFFSRMSLASHGAERDYGHTGNFWNMTWAMPAVNLSGSEATGAWMKEFGAWYFDLARSWDYSFPHQGPPEMRRDKTGGWDATGAYLLAYAMPLKKIWLTGSNSGGLKSLTEQESQKIVLSGRGWTRHDRNSAYDNLPSEVLMEGLSSWSPVVRERSADAIARRGLKPTEALITMLPSDDLNARIGACQALRKLGKDASSAVPALQKALEAEDLWLRVQAAEAIAATGDAGMVALPSLLQKLTMGPTEEDPRAMEQRYLINVVFKKMLGKHSLEGIDRELLFQAVRAGLQNQDGRARGALGSIYDRFSFEEIKPLLPAIYEAVVKPAPSGIMFADGIRGAGLKLLAKHRIKEGIPLCIELMDIQRWNKRSRMTNNLNVLESYGPAAKEVVPELRELVKQLRKHREAKGLKEITDRVEALADKLEKAGDAEPLRSIKDL